jgi:SAM-dependent methyltransferase
MTTRYAERFQPPDNAAAYDAAEYGADSYSSAVWRWQRPVVEKIVAEFCAAQKTPVRLLDFACGTGRVLSALEPLAVSADGVDISASMVARARERGVKARLLVGDILAEPDLLAPEYDLISCFRFLLNAEPELRRRVLRRLREVLRTPGGRLLVNLHGNARSLRHPAIVWRRRRRTDADEMLNEMTPAAVEALLAECGFAVERRLGFGVLPPTFYRTPLRPAADWADRRLSGENPWSRFAIDLLYVCRPV